jgi:hypothetical protein
MFRLTAQLTKSMLVVPRFSYHFSPEHSETHGNVPLSSVSPVSWPKGSSRPSTTSSTKSTPSDGTYLPL